MKNKKFQYDDELDEISIEKFSQSKKLHLEEIAGITVFITIFLLTLNYPLSMFFTLIFFTFSLLFRKPYECWKKSKTDFFIKLNHYGEILLIIFIIFFIFDNFLTFIAVIKLGIAVEQNKFIIWLWKTFGYHFGETLRLIYFSCIFYSLYSFNQSKSRIKNIISFSIILFGFLFWFMAICNNIFILILHFS